MRLVLLTTTILLTICIAHQTHAGSIRVRRQVIPREFQNLNIENYLKNPRAVAFQLKCIIYDGPCDRIGKYLKVTIPELLTNQCKACDPDQRKKAGQLVAFIQQNYPREWDDAIKKFQGNQKVKPEDINRFESLLGVKIRANGTDDSPAPAGQPDLKNVANFASQIGTEVAQNVKKDDGSAPAEGPGEIKSAADFSAALSGLIKSARQSTTVKPGSAPAAAGTNDAAGILQKVDSVRDHVKNQPTFDSTTLPPIDLDIETSPAPAPAAAVAGTTA